MSDNSKPISGFIASLLNLVLVVICLKVIVMVAESKHSGEKVNITKQATKELHTIYTDIQEGWTEATASDSIVEKK